ncbi:hypothetical protein [Paludisphaera soli]|uniref:hypothetical protein n=1 Tax=Paludisphaera soli TaxID=2712865 RepID=UPI0013ED5F94|nr:hypothetical protein [Paludisphaera soli]
MNADELLRDPDEMLRLGPDLIFALSPHLREVRDRIARMPTSGRLAVAAACCDLLHPGYRRFQDERNEPDALRPIIDRFWLSLNDSEASMREIDDLANRCESAVAALPAADDVPCRVADASYRHYWEALDAVGVVDLAIRSAQADSASDAAKATELVVEHLRRRLWNGHVLRHPSDEPTEKVYAAIDRLVEGDAVMGAIDAAMAELLDHVARDERPTRASLRVPLDRLASLIQSAELPDGTDQGGLSTLQGPA